MTENNEQTSFDDLTNFTLSKELITRLDEDFCRASGVVLLGSSPQEVSDIVSLGMIDLSDDQAVFEVERIVSRKIRRVQLNMFELEAALGFGFGDESADEGSVMTLDVGKGRLALAHDNEIEFTPDQSTAKMVCDALSQAVRLRASDIHIEVYASDIDLRFRIDGILAQQSTPFSKANIKKVCSYLRVLSDLDITERKAAQDGRISTVYADQSGDVRQIDMRICVLPGPHGPDVVLRILDEDRINISLDKLGLDDASYKTLKEIIKQPGGLVIVAGPTASGKTTTLYSAMREINSDANKILTVEDPIEYEIPKVNQKQVSMHMSFADYSRAFMRQNPDMLMIGEVRDEETASAALRAAQMGHLVFTTLHARDVPSALARLLVLCSDRSLAVSGLAGILSQRLVRRICPKCVEPYEPDPEMLARIASLPEDISHVRGKGCSACNNTGYKGQTGVFELLKFNGQLRSIVLRGDAIDLESVSGFRPMLGDAVEKLRAGVTTIEEILRTVPLPDWA
ncbi:MAG: GspE/PulE family protein [Phycisphaerae bacterium]|jgi:type II secretory ATPase GspE/PulE/Tfp pilus assembly ATPase PilB-like protein|nr:GspE/PulE family protein [Phycisphaerae bacterium]